MPDRFTDAERAQLLKLSLVDLLAGRGETDVVRASRVANQNQPPVTKSAWNVSDEDLARRQQEIASTRDAQQMHANDQMARVDGVSIFRKHTGATLPLLRRRGQ